MKSPDGLGDRSELMRLASTSLFDEAWYCSTYSDVAEAGVDPFFHFVNQGWREGRSPGPYFDSAWYLEEYAEVVGGEVNPLLDFLLHGWMAGRCPFQDYDESAIRAAHPELADLGVPPVEFLAALSILERGTGT